MTLNGKLDRGKEVQVKKSLFEKYLGKPTNVYSIVDQDFLLNFNEKQGAFMLFTYYHYYEVYCKQTGSRILPIDTFLINARRRKIKLIQHCCPYCGRIDVLVNEMTISDFKAIQYCTSCGKKTTSQIILEGLGAFVRMATIHRAGLNVLEKDEEDKKILGYDVMLTEIIQLTSILETTLREFYIDLVSIRYRCYGADFLFDMIKRESKNDFMNIDKANQHYHKALGLNLRHLVSSECRENLIDLVNVRNIAVHNNGSLDSKFRKSATYDRLIDYISGDLIFVTPELVDNYLEAVLTLIGKIEDEYNKRFLEDKFQMISNYYFNLGDKEDDFHFETISTECGANLTIKVIDSNSNSDTIN